MPAILALRQFRAKSAGVAPQIAGPAQPEQPYVQGQGATQTASTNLWREWHGVAKWNAPTGQWSHTLAGASQRGAERCSGAA